MKRSEFKKRMQSLKSYREQNPDKGYWDWRASLPDNLRYTDNTEYDMYNAYKSGAQPRLEDDGLYHLPTRDPYTGKILKASTHPTYWKGLTIDSELGYKPYFVGKDTYTWNDEDGPFIPWQKVEQFDEGGGTDGFTPVWRQQQYQMPTYDQVLKFLKKDDPAAYNRLAEARAREQNPTSEIVRYVDANGNIATASNAQGLQPVVTPEDLPGIGDAAEVYNIGKDFVEGNYGAAAAGLGLLAIPGGAAGKIYRNSRNILTSLAFKPNSNKIQTVNELFRNKEWNNFLSTRNGDAYYRMQRTPGIVSTNVSRDNGGYFISHTTPWEEFSGLGSSEGNGMTVLYEFPTQTFGVLKASNDKGYYGLNDVTEMGRKHLLYGDTSSGKRDFVRIMSDNDAELLDTSPYKIGLIDRPLTPNGKYDTRPPYEDIHQGNQTTVSAETLNNAILNTDYNWFQYSPEGIIKGLHVTSYQRGGEVPPDNSPVHVNPFTRKPLANGSITPVLDLEDASGFTPIGDVLSIRDAYIAARNKDLLGLGLAGLGVIPFIPTVNRKAAQDLMDRAIRQSEKSKQVVDDFYTQRNNVYESMIENEDAFRRAAEADRLAGTNYVGVYGQNIRDYLRDPSIYNDNLPTMRFDGDLYNTNIKMQVDPRNPESITVNPRYKDPDELDDAFKRINPGLVRHEMGHQTDLKAGLQYTDRLADPSKFVSDKKLKEMFPKTHTKLKSTVLNKGSEIKSYMNEFREFLIGERQWEPKESVKSFRRKLDEYSKQFPTLRMIFDSYKSKSDFVRDYNMVPLTDAGTNQNLV